MRKSLFLLLILIASNSFSQNLTSTNFNSGDISNNIILKNGNTLNFASVNLDNWSADSDCQCTEYQVGKVFWVFETNNNLEIIKERCFSKDGFPGIWLNDCAPDINDIYYIDDEVVIHFLANSSGQDYTGPGGGSSLLTFNLETFDFENPVVFPTSGYPTSGYRIINKVFKVGDYYLYLYAANNTNDSNASTIARSLIATNGYQEFNIVDKNGNNWLNNQYIDINQIFEGNSNQMILDYKKKGTDIISFLVVSNSLDGLYTEGVRGKTSLFIIDINFSDISSLEYSVIKSELEIRRDTRLHYEDYQVFIDRNNSFVLNKNVIRDTGGMFSLAEFNELHFLEDDGSFKTIPLTLDYTQSWSTEVQSYTLGNGYNQVKLLDVEFSDSNFMTLERRRVQIFVDNPSSTNIGFQDIRFYNLYAYDGSIISRELITTSLDGVNSFEFDDKTKSNIIVYNSSEYFSLGRAVGLKFDGSSSYIIDNFDNRSDCTNYHSSYFKFNNYATLGIDNFTLDNELAIYPNPTDNTLFITGNETPIAVAIYNVLGKEVLSVKNTNNINVQALPSGVYIIRISDGMHQTNRKFIKN